MGLDPRSSHHAKLRAADDSVGWKRSMTGKAVFSLCMLALLVMASLPAAHAICEAEVGEYCNPLARCMPCVEGAVCKQTEGGDMSDGVCIAAKPAFREDKEEGEEE